MNVLFVEVFICNSAFFFCWVVMWFCSGAFVVWACLDVEGRKKSVSRKIAFVTFLLQINNIELLSTNAN